MSTPSTQSTPVTALTILNNNLTTLAQLVLVNMPSGATLNDATRLALKEITNFQMMAQMKPEFLNCKPESILLAVKQCICDNLTLAPSAGLVYLTPGQVKVSINPDKYEWVLTYDPTANGRLSIARQSGRILDHKRPVITYDSEGRVSLVSVEFLVPSYQNPRWEKIEFGKVNFEKWRLASARKNRGEDKANANYKSWMGGIDPEFAGTKAIRHGLGKLGANMNEPHQYERAPSMNHAKLEPHKSHSEIINSFHPATNLADEEETEEIRLIAHKEVKITRDHDIELDVDPNAL